MKNLIYCIVFAVTFMAISCHKDEPDNLTLPEDNTETVTDNETNEEDETQDKDEPQDMTTVVPVAFLVSTDSDRFPDGLTRYAMEVYCGEEKVDETINIYDFPNTNSALIANLREGKQYTCLIWADNGTDSYDISEGLKNVRAGIEPSLAFSGTMDFNTDTKKYEISLQPAVAQIVLKINGTTEGGSGYFGISSATPLNYDFNVATGDVTETVNSYSPSVDFNVNNNVAKFYTFASESGTNVDLIVDCNGKSQIIKNMTIQKGRTLTLEGDLSNMDFNIKISDIGENCTDTEL